ncbi:hypothetical protein [Butyrivibrio sp. AE3004]|nr:hypothetical protein [Butyrivibrio sp. AE3004]
MDLRKYMIIAKGEICTKKVRSCVKNLETNKYDVTYCQINLKQ